MNSSPKLRLAVFDVPETVTPEEVLKTVGIQGHPFLIEVADAASEGIVVIRLCLKDLEEVKTARTLLMERIYPLWFYRANFVVLANFPSGQQKSVIPKSPEHELILDDIFSLLRGMSHHVALGDTASLDGYIQTPIEQELSKALDKAGFIYSPQTLVGRHRLDFLVEHDGTKIGVEADGAQFHDPERDAERDAIILGQGIPCILRFTGSRIMKDPVGCVQEIRNALAKGSSPRGSYALDSDLDPSQSSAVNHSHGPARVLAPAGSGKTKTMINRIVNLLNRGIPAENILVLAFNKKAADQLRNSLALRSIPVAKTLVGEGSSGVVASTFHSFGSRYMREIIGVKPVIEQDTHYWNEMMRRALASAGITMENLHAQKGSDPIGRFLEGLERAKSDLQPPESISVEVETSKGGTETFAFGKIFDAFMEETIQAHRYSFDDLLYITHRDLLDNAAHRRRLQARFSYVLVDEYQDLNAVQLQLVELIARPTMNLFVVGDDDQLIYGWRYAKPENILGFENRFTSSRFAHTYVLETNYRCSQAIVDASRRLIDNNTKRVYKNYHARPGAPAGRIPYFPSKSWQERANTVIHFLREEKERSGCDWRKLAILCRYKILQPLMAQELDREGIPRTTLLNYRLLTHSKARVVRGYVEVISSPYTASGEMWAACLNAPNRYLRNDDIQTIRTAVTGWEVITRWKNEDSKIFRSVRSAANEIEALHKTFGIPGVSGDVLIQQINERFQLTKYWTDQATTNKLAKADDANAEALMRALELFASDYNDIEPLLVGWHEQEVKETSPQETAEDNLFREEDENRDAVVIGTIHSSKGREYDSVVLLDYECNPEGLAEAEMEEERRVLYVGVTRAKSSLLITIPNAATHSDTLVRETMLPGSEDERKALEKRKAELITVLAAERSAIKELRARKEKISSGEELRNTEVHLEMRNNDLERIGQEQNELQKHLHTGGLRKMFQHISASGRKRISQSRELTQEHENISGVIQALEDWKVKLTEARLEVLSQLDDQLVHKHDSLLKTGEQYQQILDRTNEISILGTETAGYRG